MTRDDVLDTLRRYRRELERRGIEHVSLFGSLARGDDASGSDIDLAVMLDPGARISLFEFVGLKRYLAGLLERDVDIVKEPARNRELQSAIDRDRRLAF